MDFKLSFKVNEAVYLRDPEASELGKLIIKHSIDLIYNLGFESFTFKKLAVEMGTTEASVYRYLLWFLFTASNSVCALVGPSACETLRIG